MSDTDECESHRRLGRYCRRASCSKRCHKLYVLDARCVMGGLFERFPETVPKLVIRVSGNGMSDEDFRPFHRNLTDQLSRAKIEYALVTAFMPYPHDAGFVRGGSRDEVVAAIHRAAKRSGITLAPGQYAVAKIKTLTGYTHYITKDEEIDGPAPKWYRVFTSSRQFFPLSFQDARDLLLAERATNPDPKKRGGFMPSDRVLDRISRNAKRRSERAADRRSVAPRAGRADQGRAVSSSSRGGTRSRRKKPRGRS